jgi:hypothetical protein
MYYLDQNVGLDLSSKDDLINACPLFKPFGALPRYTQ